MGWLPIKQQRTLAIIAIAGLLSACNQQNTASSSPVNTISYLDVTFSAESQRYQLVWQESIPEQPVAIAVAAAGQEFITLVSDHQASNYQWQPADSAARYTFKIIPAQGHAVQAATRWLTLEGGKNFRDMGGYTTADGRQVRWGKLYRSGALAGLTDSDFEQIDDLDIGSVIDFRTTPEREAEPTQWRDKQTDIRSWNYDMNMAAFGQVFREPNLTPARVEAFMASMYPGMLESLTDHYITMFDTLASSEDAMVFHCTAGKDRTGIAGALILTALGVDRETIVADFMLSDVYYAQQADAMAAAGKMGKTAQQSSGVAAPHNPAEAMMKKLSPELIKPLMGVRESYINSAFDAMTAKSGSVMTYIQEELQVSDAELAQLRDNLLEPAN